MVHREVRVPYKPTGRPNGRPKKPAPVSGVCPRLTEKQWAAARFVAANPESSLAGVARAVNVSRQAVHQWISDETFKMGRVWLDVQALLKCLEEGDSRRKAEKEAAVRKYLGTKETAFELLYFSLMADYRRAEAANPGTWSVVSMADGQTYTDPQAYIDHLRQSGCVPVGHLPDVGSPEWERMQQALRGRGFT